jgi:hypothetical protein
MSKDSLIAPASLCTTFWASESPVDISVDKIEFDVKNNLGLSKSYNEVRITIDPNEDKKKERSAHCM